MFLTLDTSHGASVALLDGYTTLARAANDNPREHTEALSPMITEVAREAGATMNDLTGVVVGTGPAPFTGLRVGLITARTLAYALGIEVYGVPALAGVARVAFDDEDLGEVTIVTDARRKEVYWARYAPVGAHDVRELSAPAVARPADLAARIGDHQVRGQGVVLYPEHFTGTPVDVDPAALGRIARARLEADPGAHLPTEPLYLRRPDIHQSQGRKRAS